MEEGYDLGLAMDGDADRIAILDEKGRYISVNDLLLLLYWYLHEVRGERGGVVRNLATTHLLDRLARSMGEQCYEVPVGFKHIVRHGGAQCAAGRRIVGRAHHPRPHPGQGRHLRLRAGGRDAGPHRPEDLRDCSEAWNAITGPLYSLEENIPATPEMRVAIPRRLKEAPSSHSGNIRSTQITHDGTKLLLENDNWALLRFSGTEPVLRLIRRGRFGGKSACLDPVAAAVCAANKVGTRKKDRDKDFSSFFLLVSHFLLSINLENSLALRIF
jgi:phosphomannomutase